MRTVPNLAAGFRRGTFVQAEFPPSDSACLRPGPFAPRSLPASSLLWAGPTPDQATLRLFIPVGRWLTPPRRVSQVPRLICPRAPSPTTPEGPTSACTRYFPIGSRLHHSLAGWPPSTGLTRPTRVRFRYGSRVRPSKASSAELLPPTLAGLLVERVIHKVNSFQFTRSARLALALQSISRKRKNSALPVMLGWII